jgi:hypothetical protein
MIQMPTFSKLEAIIPKGGRAWLHTVPCNNLADMTPITSKIANYADLRAKDQRATHHPDNFISSNNLLKNNKNKLKKLSNCGNYLL